MIGETSILEFLCYPLKLLPWVKRYYDKRSWREPSLYEHVMTGILVNAANGVHDVWWLKHVVLALLFGFHVVLKEVIIDAKKRTTPEEWDAFAVDLTTRMYGILLGLPLSFL